MIGGTRNERVYPALELSRFDALMIESVIPKFSDSIWMFSVLY